VALNSVAYRLQFVSRPFCSRRLELCQQGIILNPMVEFSKRRDNEAVAAWRVLTGWVAAIILAIALAASAPQIEAMPDENTRGTAAEFAAGEQGAGDFSRQTLACHMHFEHHQLVRSETAFMPPAPEALGACYLTRVNPLASLEPHPPKKPPRA
jgi:hypothetical protein